jgi:hypothetical protein
LFAGELAPSYDGSLVLRGAVGIAPVSNVGAGCSRWSSSARRSTGAGCAWKDRRLALRTRTSLALGFGVAVFVCFLVPFGAVLVIPAAVAGATLLARGVLGASLERRGAQ